MNGPRAKTDLIVQGCFVHSTPNESLVVNEDMVMGVRGGRVGAPAQGEITTGGHTRISLYNGGGGGGGEGYWDVVGKGEILLLLLLM